MSDHMIRAPYEARGTLTITWDDDTERPQDDLKIRDGSVTGEFECTCGETFHTESAARDHLWDTEGSE